jgi:hypothetical protein
MVLKVGLFLLKGEGVGPKYFSMLPTTMTYIFGIFYSFLKAKNLWIFSLNSRILLLGNECRVVPLVGTIEIVIECNKMVVTHYNN